MKYVRYIGMSGLNINYNTRFHPEMQPNDSILHFTLCPSVHFLEGLPRPNVSISCSICASGNLPDVVTKSKDTKSKDKGSTPRDDKRLLLLRMRC